MTDTKKILYIDLDNTLVDFKARLEGIDAGVLQQYQRVREGELEPETFYDEIPGIFALMPPVPGAIEAFHRLSEVFDIYILSTAPWGNPSAWQHKVEWVQLHLGRGEESPAYKRLILSHHKNLNRGHFLVDDRPNHRGAREFGEFDGQELVYFASDQFPDWGSVTEYLLARA